MNLKFDEATLIALYKKDTRRKTIEEIKEMMTHLETDEKDLKDLAESALKKLTDISDDEFNETEIYESFDILE